MASYGVQAVEEFGKLLDQMLNAALVIKPTSTIEPPLNKSDLAEFFERVPSIFPPTSSLESRKHVIDTAVRDAFNNLLASTTIDSPEFVKLWDLLDIISILSDDEQTEPGLLFWLVEELLDSQTIAGCRRIFDYLESRRERITAKHFGQKNLVILRSCNELLRRLSRAEDTAFCGRVFIFLFQSFPLGDKSSVNLRGEYHVENVTTFDDLPAKGATPEEMGIDPEIKDTKQVPNGITKKASEESGTATKGVSFLNAEKALSADALYPIFWSLQQNFSQPKRLFDPANFAEFKAGLEATMTMFKTVQAETMGRPSKAMEESKRGTKRKRGQGDDDLANAFNPKYLTSRDLFELEISDLSFRRHILVQVLIIMDFLLSLSVKAKEKLSKASLPQNANKSVMYADQLLSEEDAKWALDMKRSIAEYLKQGFEGAFFYRMVETVLSRDKNWARWKIENCPSFARDSVTPQEYIQAKTSARQAATRKRLRGNNWAVLDLTFLSQGDSRKGLERLKDPSRYQLPSYKTFQSKIDLDDMDIDMAMDEEVKNAAVESKASKSWRALRIASGTKLVAFDKIERSDKIDDIFRDDVKAEEQVTNGDEEAVDNEETFLPKDRRPIAVSGPSGVGKGTLVTMLMEKHAKVLGKKASHTTRQPREGEVHSQHYFFVSKDEYNVMRDGDQFIEYNNFNGNDYGTSQKVVEGIIASGKIPVMEMEMHGIQQLKDNGYAARFIFLAPPGIPELERRLQRRGSDDKETIQKRLEIAQQELEHSKAEEGFYDKIIVNDDLEMAYKQLENYIFGIEEDNEEPSVLTVGDEKENPAQVASTEVEMVDGELPAGYSSKIDGSGGDNAKAIAANANKIRESVAAEMETS